MGFEFRKRCLEYAIEQCRRDAITSMTDDEIIAEWGLQRSSSGPLHAAASRISKLEMELVSLSEREKALREALEPSAKTKNAYIGEIKDTVKLYDQDGDETHHEHAISWTAIKAVMAMIVAHAAKALEPK